MAKVSIDAAETLLSLLRSSQGFSAAMAEIQIRDARTVPELGESQMSPGHLSGDLAEEWRGFQYPALFVYCDKVANSHREKFRKFSGKARLNIEIKVSQKHMEELERELETYVDAATEVLHRTQGDWGRGVSYPGSYEVVFDAVKRGGKNYLQTAAVVLEVDVSQS